MRFFFLLALLGTLLFSATAIAAGDFSGSAELSYAEYRAELGGKEIADASHFTQQYSLLYEKKGVVGSRRFGSYDLALGGEWNAIAGEVNGEEIDLDSAKVFYRGEINIAPGALPFRLRLYSHDLKRTRLTTTTDSSGALIDPEIIDDFDNGQHLTSGITLLLGIRNGSYAGRYRDVLSQLPRLLMDFKEDYVRDLRSLTPRHYRQRNLAFVSLNKKDNWFHYRYLDYVDYLNHSKDFEEKSYMLGTIDHQLTRRWIHLTNWIKASADATYSESSLLDPTRIEARGDKSYVLNLFGLAKRSTWQASTFSSFQRNRDDDGLIKSMEVPVYLDGEIDRNTSWRFRFVGTRFREDALVLGENLREEEGDLLASTRIETFRQAPYVVASTVDIHFSNTEKGEGESKGYDVRAGVDFYSNNRYRHRYNLSGGYHVARSSSTSSSGSEVSSWEHAGIARVDTKLTSKLNTGVTQRLIYNTGGGGANLSREFSSDIDLGGRADSTFRSLTTWYGEHIFSAHLNNRVDARIEFQKSGKTTTDLFRLSHRLSYNRRALRVKMNSSFETKSGNTSGGDGGTTSSRSKMFSQYLRVRYSPGRAWEGGLDYEYNWEDDASTDRREWSIRQSYLHNFFHVNGLVRKIVDVSEELKYSSALTENGPVPFDERHTSFSLAGNYYPKKSILLGATLVYQFSDRFGSQTDQFSCNLRAGVNFAKLQFSFNYAYGTRSDSDDFPERTEHRWEARVKKVF